MVVVPHAILDAALWNSMAAILAGGALLMIANSPKPTFTPQRPSNPPLPSGGFHASLV
jgi:hypothetical protein